MPILVIVQEVCSTGQREPRARKGGGGETDIWREKERPEERMVKREEQRERERGERKERGGGREREREREGTRKTDR